MSLSPRAQFIVTLLLIHAVCPAGTSGQTPAEIAEARDHVRQAFAARGAGDLDSYEDQLQLALSLRPGHPQIMYLLAGAHAMQGDTMPAIRILCGLGSMGLSFPADGDSAFASLHDLDPFRNVVRVMARNGEAEGEASTAFVLPDRRAMLPEGLARDPGSGDFFLAGVHSGRILRVAPDGTARVFVDRGPDTWAFTGLALDAERGRLWAATTATEEYEGLAPDHEGRAAVVAYDVETGERLGYHVPPGGEPHFLGDIAVAADGTVYVSSAFGGPIYTVDGAAAPDATLAALVPAGVFASPQGIAPSPDGRLLHVADYSRGLFLVDRATGAVDMVAASPLVALRGIDGLVRAGDDLIAIQNGTRPQRILRLRLTREHRVGPVEVLAAALPEWSEPTQGTVVDGRLYFVATSNWPAFADGDPDPAALNPPRVMWLELP